MVFVRIYTAGGRQAGIWRDGGDRVRAFKAVNFATNEWRSSFELTMKPRRHVGGIFQ